MKKMSKMDKKYLKGLEKSKSLALKGDAKEQLRQGYECYLEKNYTQAFEWWKKSAIQGKARAQYNLGVAYYEGWGVEKDYKQAVYWWRKSAIQGNADAQCSLGTIYDIGKPSVKKNYDRAVYWNVLSANQGHREAELWLKVKEHKDSKGIKKTFGGLFNKWQKPFWILDDEEMKNQYERFNK